MFFDTSDPDERASRAPFDPEMLTAAEQEEYEAMRAGSPPDPLDEVLDSSAVISAFAAERLVRIDRFRREGFADAAQRAEEDGRQVQDHIVMRSLRLELASALRITEYAAEELLALAQALVHDYPSALESLQRSRITEQHARVLVDMLTELSRGQRAAAATQALQLAERHPLGTFRRALRRLIDRLRNDDLPERHEKAVAERRVCVEKSSDGMAWLSAYIPEVEAQAIFERLTAMGKCIKDAPLPDGEREPANPRTMDQLRADVLSDLLIDGSADAHPEQARGIRASVVVTVPALSLLSDEHAAASDPATVEGMGPIPLDRARELAGGAESWMRVLTHPETGMVLSVGRTQYRPPAALRRLVKWRADRCMAPGCGIPASRCEIDHNLAWEHGGHTSLENHAPFCKGHHTIKHHGEWTVTQVPDGGGAIQWISPTGRRYRVEPERRVPVFRSSEPSAAPF